MVKILYVTRVPITAVRFILPLANKLRERGNEVEFAFGPGEGQKEMEDSGFSFTLLPLNKKSRSLKNASVVWELMKLIRDGRYDAVHTYSPVIGLYGRLAAYFAKTPIVVHSVIGSMLASGVPITDRLFFVMTEILTSRLVDLFITLNDADASDMVKYCLVPAKKVVSLKYEYGVDLNEFNPEKIDRRRLREAKEKYGLEDGIPVIGFVGRMIGAKGILDLFEAYCLVINKGVLAKLVYLGDVLTTDKDQQSFIKLKRLVKELSLEKNVLFLGFQTDVPFFLSLMDVVVLPSHQEGFPRIPVEAGAMRKPSISTATSGAEVAIEEGETGYITPIRNPSSLAEALTKILTSPEDAQIMGVKARDRVTKLFDQNHIVDQQVVLYNNYFSKYPKTKTLNFIV